MNGNPEWLRDVNDYSRTLIIESAHGGVGFFPDNAPGIDYWRLASWRQHRSSRAASIAAWSMCEKYGGSLARA
jgi:hypothetical protein